MANSEFGRTPYDAQARKLDLPIPVLGIAGKIASGKGTVAGIVEQRYGYPTVTFSQFLREEADRRDIPQTRDALIGIWTEWSDAEGKDVMVKRSLAKIADRYQESPFPGASIDGFRHEEEVVTFQATPSTHMMWVESGNTDEEDARMRFERAQQRGRVGDGTSFADFLRQDTIDQRTVAELRDLVPSENVITNNGSLEDLQEQVVLFMRKIS
jgi:hypothetical protein